MCHRYIQTSDLDALHQEMAFTGAPNLTPRHNIRPLQQVPVLHERDGGTRLTMMRWGLQASGKADRPDIDEIITEVDGQSPATEGNGTHLAARRCLLPADGFYECERRTRGHLQPWLVRLIEDGPFCFAGIWQAALFDTARDHPQMAYQCALLTVPDNGTIAPLAPKMPVILAKQDYATWLDPTTPLSCIRGLLKPYRDSGIYWHPVSPEILETDADAPWLADPA
jgi:putative SOS response-associated peptidase YedK